MLPRAKNNWSLWNPWDDTKLSDRIENLIDQLKLSNVAENINRYRHGVPAITVNNDGKDIVATVALPGYSKEHIQMEIVSDLLTINAERNPIGLADQERYLHRERSFGKFEEVVRLPDKVKPEAAVAKFENGVLKITIPLQEKEQPKRITIES